MAFDELAIRADEATRRARDVSRRLESRNDEFLERERTHRVSRHRFTTLVARIRATGTPYGVHTIAYRSTGEMLLVRHERDELWVLPGGGVDRDESLLEAARRELGEEAGIEVSYDGLGMLTRVDIETAGYRTRGVIPIFEARAETLEPTITDPDGEISDARWFETPPTDTRDREDLLAWQTQKW